MRPIRACRFYVMEMNAYGRSYNDIHTFTSLTSDVKWDPSKSLVLSGKEYVCWPAEYEEITYNFIKGAWTADCIKSITVKLKIGEAVSEPANISLDTLAVCELSGVTLNVMLSANDTGVAPGMGSKTAILQINPDPSNSLIEFLKVTDQNQFSNVDSPIEVIFTLTPNDINGSVDEYSAKIVVEFEEDSVSESIYYESKVQNGYSILDIKCDEVYSGTDNYILIIAKYANSIVYNSYLSVPSTTIDYQRVAFSNVGLVEVIMEIVPENDAFGDSVPGYLAYTYYVPEV